MILFLQPAEFGKLKSEEMTEEEFDRRVMVSQKVYLALTPPPRRPNALQFLL